MWIRSQNEQILINTNNISAIWQQWDSDIESHIIFALINGESNFCLGHYKAEEDGVKVIGAIENAINQKGQNVFDMSEID